MPKRPLCARPNDTIINRKFTWPKSHEPVNHQQECGVTGAAAVAACAGEIPSRGFISFNNDTPTLADQDQVLIAEMYRESYWINRYGKRFDRDKKAAYDGSYKWIWDSNGNHELYDISNDPGEGRNLLGETAETEQRLQSRLLALIEESSQLPAGQSSGNG